jgi:NitT/TauT family transport system ATP-binding protein
MSERSERTINTASTSTSTGGLDTASAVASRNGSRPVAVDIRDVSKEFGHGSARTVALRDATLRIREQELACLVGASGCGKTTLLNLIAGLDKPTRGTIDTGDRRIALMFQEATLFPWLTLAQNVELALKLRGVDKARRRARTAELLELVRLDGRGRKRPHELSGGMRQRGALARVLAQDADVVLMDEPFGALDAMTRDSMHDELERIRQEVEMTIVFVTHNVREAVRLSDRTILMESGPGRVKSEHLIDLPRPRHMEDPQVAERAGSLTHELKEEVRRHVR